VPLAELQLAVIYRYVLHLESAKDHRTLRWTFAHPVVEHDEIPSLGPASSHPT